MKWTSILRSSEGGKISAVRVAFLLWMVTMCLVWGILSFKSDKMMDIPQTVVSITMAMGATKVTHRIAESNMDKIIDALTEIVKRRLIKHPPTTSKTPRKK